MQTAQLGGPIGPLLDPATGQSLQANVQGSFTYSPAGDASAVARLQAALLHATQQVVADKLARNQIAIPTLAHSLPHLTAEIIHASGAAAMGVQVHGLQVNVHVTAPAGPAPYAGQLPPDPHTQMQNRMQQIAQDRLDPRNYEVKATVEVGGFKLNASSDKGFDSDGLAKQATEKAKTELVWWGIGCVVVGLVVIGLAGLGFYIWYQVKKSSSPPSADSAEVEKASWDGKAEFTCGGNDSVKIEGVKAKLASGTAITAQGSCRLELVDVEIDAPIAIYAGANAKVVVKGGAVQGKDAAAKALGNATITFEGTKVTGKKDALGGAKITGP